MDLNKTILASLIFSSAFIFNANASLSTVDNGLGVYDSGLNVTWTSDANLLGTMESQQGYNTVVNAIIAASPVIYDTPNVVDSNGVYNVSASDFYAGGKVTWWGAQAFAGYLNSIDYGNSNQWAMPYADPSCGQTYNCTNSQWGELYYNELGLNGYPSGNYGLWGNDTVNGVNNSSFGQRNVDGITNIQADTYWTGTEYAPSPVAAWRFDPYAGGQNVEGKVNLHYAWAVSSGQLNPVPVPGAAWLFGSALAGFGLLRKRKSV